MSGYRRGLGFSNLLGYGRRIEFRFVLEYERMATTVEAWWEEHSLLEFFPLLVALVLWVMNLQIR